MTFPYDRSNNPLAPITWGRDFNFFQKLVVTASSFNTNCDMVITFPTDTVTFQLEAGTGVGAIQYSFNGNTVHGDLSVGTTGLITSNNLVFRDRIISKIWFKGAGTVRVEAWANQ
jgi:hypothetical protein